MCCHDKVVCSRCGSERWRIFRGPCDHITVSCVKCGHAPPVLVEQDEQATPIHYFVNRTKPLAQLTAADIPPGIDPDDVAADPTRFVRV